MMQRALRATGAFRWRQVQALECVDAALPLPKPLCGPCEALHPSMRNIHMLAFPHRDWSSDVTLVRLKAVADTLASEAKSARAQPQRAVGFKGLPLSTRTNWEE